MLVPTVLRALTRAAPAASTTTAMVSRHGWGLHCASSRGLASKSSSKSSGDGPPPLNEEVLELGLGQVRLVLPDGVQELVDPEAAMGMARDAGLDLVMVAAKAVPPVCKLLDFRKLKYENATRTREQARKQREARTVTKEIRLSETIGKHDLGVKLAQVEGFLQKKYHVTVSINNPKSKKLALESILAFEEQLSGLAVSEQPVRVKGNKLALVLMPPKD
eukprot:TRINITY_DN54867_c0_g1_i2.p2 TRINITY_DN54867_c0_g1~~TRINITY_DN54867_c0_g1_i2.p2  ORF type:complete len:219 (-),score=62.27 TRINITY_DN54867_c0_g1_i2:190-846(-)